MASRRSFWSRDPRAPGVSSATPAGISELVIPVHAEFQTELILFLTCFWFRLIFGEYHACTPSRSSLHQEGQTDIFPGAAREGAATVPLGPGSFLINSGRCGAPRLLCIRCIPGSPYEVHLPHTRSRIEPRRGRRSVHWSPADTGGAGILLGGRPALTTAYPSSSRQIYIKSSSIPAGEGLVLLEEMPGGGGQIKRAGVGGRRRGLGLSVM